ncbi:hypothetical protein K8R43_03655, partial [archaeon]|nr:hypothetical protein [archaeon]
VTIGGTAGKIVDIALERISTCEEEWDCTVWSPCINNVQARTCTDLNECGTEYDKPSKTQSCSLKTCYTDLDCDDENACTIDVCEEGILCTNSEITQCKSGDDCCPQGCNYIIDNDCSATGGGGENGGSNGGTSGCTSDGECEDSNQCTSDYCYDGNCVHEPINEGSSCGTDLICCDGACEGLECESNSDCEDDDPCFENFTCMGSGCDAYCDFDEIEWCDDGSDGCCPYAPSCPSDPDCGGSCTNECTTLGEITCNEAESTLYNCTEGTDGCYDLTVHQNCSNCGCTCGSYINETDGNELNVSCTDEIDNDCDNTCDSTGCGLMPADEDCANCVFDGETCTGCACDPFCCSGKCDTETDTCFSCTTDNCYGEAHCSSEESGECESECLGVPPECDNTDGSMIWLIVPTVCDVFLGETFFADECYQCSLQENESVCKSSGTGCTAHSNCEGIAPGTELTSCTAVGESFFVDECTSGCQLADHDNICRSSSHATGCTGDSYCNGLTIGASCNGGTGNCNSTCQCDSGSPPQCEEDGEGCSVDNECCSYLLPGTFTGGCDDNLLCFGCHTCPSTSVNACNNQPGQESQCEPQCGADSECNDRTESSYWSDIDYCNNCQDCVYESDNTIGSCTCSGGSCASGTCLTDYTCYHAMECSLGGWTADNCPIDVCGSAVITVNKNCVYTGCTGGNEHVCNDGSHVSCDEIECQNHNYTCTTLSGPNDWRWHLEGNLPEESTSENNCNDGVDNDCDGYCDILGCDGKDPEPECQDPDQFCHAVCITEFGCSVGSCNREDGQPQCQPGCAGAFECIPTGELGEYANKQCSKAASSDLCVCMRH